MKFDGEIVCPFCLKALTKRMIFKVPKVFRWFYKEKIEAHKPDCPQWNEEAWAIQVTKQQ